MRTQTKVLTAEFAGHAILVTNAWRVDWSSLEMTSEARLNIDGVLVDRNDALTALSTKEPLLSGSLADGNTTRRIEVFCRAIIRVRMKICVDGVKIAGDLR